MPSLWPRQVRAQGRRRGRRNRPAISGIRFLKSRHLRGSSLCKGGRWNGKHLALINNLRLTCTGMRNKAHNTNRGDDQATVIAALFFATSALQVRDITNGFQRQQHHMARQVYPSRTETPPRGVPRHCIGTARPTVPRRTHCPGGGGHGCK